MRQSSSIGLTTAISDSRISHERHHPLACSECKRRNYSTTKNKKKTTERLELSKFCRFCRKHTPHKETK